MDELERAAIRARADAATEGPWEVHEEIDGYRSGRRTVVKAGGPPVGRGSPLRVVTVDQTRDHHDEKAEANIEFIAAARTDVPRLLRQVEELEQSLAARDADLAQAQANARVAIELREHTDRDNDQLRQRVATAEALSFSHGFELARQAPTVARARGWEAKARKLEVELAALRAYIAGIDDWAEEGIGSAEQDLADKQQRGRADRWDAGWAAALKVMRQRLRAGQRPPYEVDHGCECGGVCPNCARYGCETCCDGEMPSDHGSRDGSVQTFDYDDLRRHLVSAHRDGAALGLSDYEALNEHDHEHRGPGTIRDHDVDSRDWSQDRIDETIAELKKREGGGGV